MEHTNQQTSNVLGRTVILKCIFKSRIFLFVCLFVYGYYNFGRFHHKADYMLHYLSFTFYSYFSSYCINMSPFTIVMNE